MIRTVKPPPKVNPYQGSPPPQAYPAPQDDYPQYPGPDDGSYYHQESNYGGKYDNKKPDQGHGAASLGLGEADFEALVQEEMRKMEQELMVSLAPSHASYSSLPPADEEAHHYDVFERPMPALAAGSPIKLSVESEQHGGMFQAAAPFDARMDRSPGRRKGGAFSNLYGEKDNRMNQKAAQAAEYANFLQKQIDEKEVAKERERRERMAPTDDYQLRQPVAGKPVRRQVSQQEDDSPPPPTNHPRQGVGVGAGGYDRVGNHRHNDNNGPAHSSAFVYPEDPVLPAAAQNPPSQYGDGGGGGYGNNNYGNNNYGNNNYGGNTKVPTGGDDNMERLRRLQQQGHSSAQGGYKPSGWGAVQGWQPNSDDNGAEGADEYIRRAPQQQQQQRQPQPQPQLQTHTQMQQGGHNDAQYGNAYGSPVRVNQHHFSPNMAANGIGGGSDMDEKQRKKQKQIEYRLMLERQMADQKKQKDQMNLFWKGEDIPAEVSEDLKSQGVKHYAKRGQQADAGQTNGNRQGYSQSSQYNDDDDHHHQKQQQQQQLHYQQQQQPTGGYENDNGYRHSDQYTRDNGAPSNASPGKKTSAARNRLIQDVFGKVDLLNGVPNGADNSPAGKWKPSERGESHKRGMPMNDYRALLDQQMKEQTRLKEEEKKRIEMELEEDKMRMLKYQQEIEAEKEAETRRKRVIEAEEEAENQRRQEIKAQELLAKKHGHRSQDEQPAPSHPASSGNKREVGGQNPKFSPDRLRMESIAENSFELSSPGRSAPPSTSEQLKAPKTPPRFSRVNMGDGLSNKYKQPSANFRNLQEEVSIEERGATPGGALACNTSLVPIRDSVGGNNNIIRNSGASNISYSSQWRQQVKNSKYHQHHPHSNYHPDIPKYDPVEDVEDDAIVVAWQEDLNRQAREGNFVSPRQLYAPQGKQGSSSDPYRRAAYSSESKRRGSEDRMHSATSDPWGPQGLLSALGDRGHAPSPRGSSIADMDKRPIKSNLSNNIAEQSLASESFFTYIENRRPMTQATQVTIESEKSNNSYETNSQAMRRRMQEQDPGSPLEGMLRSNLAEDQQRKVKAARKKERYEKPYYEDESVASSSKQQYDSLNNLLRNSEERAGQDLFEIGSKHAPKYRGKAPIKHRGYTEEYTDDGDNYRYSDEEELLVMNK